MKVLLAIDGSEYSEASAASILARKWPDGSALDVVTVIEPYVQPSFPLPYQDFAAHHKLEYDEKLKQAESMVGALANQLKSEIANVKIIPHVLTGHAADSIIEAAEKFGTDLIVMGSQGRNAIAKFFLGSVSQKVLLHAGCSVEIVKAIQQEKSPAKTDTRNVLVPVDFSESSNQVIETVKKMVWCDKTHILLLSVTESPVRQMIGSELSGPSALRISEELRQLRNRLEDKLSEIAKALKNENGLSNTEVSWKVREGDPRGEIIDEAISWPADIVMMGSRGHTGLARLVLGSVAQAVVNHSPCSVQIVKSKD